MKFEQYSLMYHTVHSILAHVRQFSTCLFTAAVVATAVVATAVVATIK